MYAQSDEVYPVEELPIPLAILLSDWPQIADVSTPPQSRAPFVEFRARDRLPGHAFVAYGEQITTVTGNVVMVNQAVFGFYPVSDASKLQVKLLSTNGQLGFKMADLRSTVSKAFFVDDKTFSAVKAVFQKWSSNAPEYSLFETNCNSFALEVARQLGVRDAPEDPGSTLPVKFVETLIKAIEALRAAPNPPLSVRVE